MNIFLILLSALLLNGTVFAVEKKAATTGHLKGEIIVEGKIPKITQKKSVKKFNLYGYNYSSTKKDEDEKKEGHIVVYLEGVEWSSKSKSSKHRLGQKNKSFSTDVLPIVGGDRVDITNDEKNLYHHVFSKTKPWDFDLKKKGPGEKNSVSFAAPAGKGPGVVSVFCDFHSDMSSKIIVLDSPFYSTVLESGGDFEIKDIPRGEYMLTAWHNSLKPIRKSVTIQAGKVLSANLTMKGEKE